MQYYVGIDLGGTFIKGGIVDERGEILLQDKVPTQCSEGGERVVENISRLALNLLAKSGVDKATVVGLGLGAPGIIDCKRGEVILSENLYLEHFPLRDKVAAQTGLRVEIANDANVATLGEVKFGAAQAYDDVIMLTLGTGVGGGIVVGGKIVEGNQGAGAELGHTVLKAGGEPCACGRRGCFEAYSSASALIRETKRAMQAHKDSKLWEIGGLDEVTGKTAFDYMEKDIYAKQVVDAYVELLGCGVTNFANVFRPQAILLGGGICAEGDRLIKPLQAIVDREIFAGNLGPRVPILVAALGNLAGVLGAAALLM